MARTRDINRVPGLAASLVLHAGVVALLLLSLQHAPKPMTMGPAVPVTIVNGPPADMPTAAKAEQVQAAQAPEPQPAAPEAPPAPPTPEPKPQPAPAPPPPEPKPAPKPVPPKPVPAKPAPPKPAPPKPAPPKPTPPKRAPPKPTAKPAPQAKPQPTKATPQPSPAPAKSAPAKSASTAKSQPRLDFDALSASLAGLTSKKPGGHPSSARQGPARAATAPVASQGAGISDHLSASEIDGLRSKVEKLWNPNCEVDGGSSVVVRVHMRLTPDGRLIGRPELVSKSGANDAVTEASADRAISAAGRGAPYNDVLQPDHYNVWKDVNFTFTAKSACAGR